MKCPKCGYLGFEEVTRCRNCGHDFTVASPVGAPELPLRNTKAAADHDPFAAIDLPLFGHGDLPADFPILAKVTPPRPPLAVRRATPELPRVRPESGRTPMLDLAIPEAAREAPPVETVISREGPPRRVRTPIILADSEPAGFPARALAAAIDLAVLGFIDLVVVYFTLQICGLTLADASRLPKVPLLAFLMLQNGGYLAAFTAGGQTLGKMTAGIRVVSVDGPAPDLGRSLKRTLLWGLLAAPAGLGFVTAIFDADRRGLHDRLAGTRVIRAGLA